VNLPAWGHLAAALVLAPLLQGVINRVKALVAGRRGPPLLQGYRDLAKLLRKGAVYSRTTTWVFRAGPVVQLAATVAALGLVPLAGAAAVVAFPGDLFVALYLLALGRFVTLLAALDTGSSFEGMGASREAQFSALAEPALMLGLLALARLTHGLSLSALYAAVTPALWSAGGIVLALTAAALFVVLLAENARIPVDDPNTHLELTMIHEVMVLDHGGPDFALIGYGAALKLWVFAALLAGLVVPVRTGAAWIDAAAALGGVAAVGVAVGLVESGMARLRLLRVPPLLVSAAALAALAFLFVVAR
jgi:formate hydrogenlyase subunit 4